MKVTGFLTTTAAVLGLAGMASAQCMWGEAKQTTAEAEPISTPMPTADAGAATQPLLLLQTETEEG